MQVRRPSRRAVLAAGGLAGLGAAAGGAWWEWGRPPGQVRLRRFRSAARGCEVEVAVMTPPGADPARLPVCLALHGRGGQAGDLVGMGLPSLLAAAVRDGGTPYALIAVDGNPDSYWIARTPDDDPQAMLLGELPGWLAGMGLTADGGLPRAVLGVSMGCFGALVYARQRPVGLIAVAALSPALFRGWTQARARHAFSGEPAWAAAEPLRHLGALPAGLRLGVWCGEQDPFAPVARELARRAPAAVASFGPGGHDFGYYRTALPAIVHFLGEQLRPV
jgi:enterochelin esterase-like enzyme